MNRQDTVDLRGQLFKAKKVSLKKDAFKKDISLLMIIGVVGCIGTLFIFKKAWFHEENSSANNLSTITISQNVVGNQKSISNKDFLIVDGSYIIDKPLKFSIPNFNPKAIYEMNFGDGKIQQFNKQEFKHTYSNEGSFNIEMKMLFKKESPIIFNSKVEITNPDKNSFSANN